MPAEHSIADLARLDRLFDGVARHLLPLSEGDREVAMCTFVEEYKLSCLATYPDLEPELIDEFWPSLVFQVAARLCVLEAETASGVGHA